MKNSKKYNVILVLMVFSQLLLIGFLYYWLQDQYSKEKNILKKDLIKVYAQSKDQVVDSIIFTTIVEPSLARGLSTSDSSASTAHYTSIVVGHESDSVLENIVSINEKSPNTVISISVDGSIQSDSTIKKLQTKNMLELDELLMRTTKLYIGDSTKEGFYEFSSENITGNFPDTALFKSLFNLNAGEDKQSLMMVWHQSDTFNLRNENNKSIFISLGSNSIFPQLEIKQFSSLLLKKISPQILFALALVIITALSFYMAWRNILSQQRSNRIRNEFVSNITHELKTPVATVKVALEALKTFNLKNDKTLTEQYINMSEAEVARLESLVEKILQLSRIEEKQQDIYFEQTNITDLCKNLISTYKTRFENDKAKVNLKYPEEDLIILADPILIEGVIINIIDNSIKYSGNDPQIEIEIEDKNKEVIISISDNGPGIPEEYINKVFDRFFRVPGYDKHNVKGYGLGLSYVKAVMKQHNAKVNISNLEKGGCSFTLTFNKEV